MRDEWCWRFKLKSISPFSILKMNTLYQILLEKTRQALKIQKHKCLRIDIGRCVELWVFNMTFFLCKRQRFVDELGPAASETQFCHQ